MNPEAFDGAEAVMTQPANWPESILDYQSTPYRQVRGDLQGVVVRFQPTPEEVAQLVSGGSVSVFVVTPTVPEGVDVRVIPYDFAVAGMGRA